VIAGVALLAVRAPAAEPLPVFNVDITQSSVCRDCHRAGIWPCTVQFEVAFSSILKSAGIIAGGPY
jgi:poly(3-hydroxybutyrate) depolymerase